MSDLAWNSRAPAGLLGRVPEGWIIDSIESVFDNDMVLVYGATLSRRDQYGSCIEWEEGTGPTPEQAVDDAGRKVKS